MYSPAFAQSFATLILSTQEKPWDAGDYHRNKSLEAHASYTTDTPGFISGTLSNLRGLAETLPSAMSGMKFEAFSLYSGIPYRAAYLHAWVAERLGPSASRFLHNVRGVELRRAFAFGLRENFAPPHGQTRQWSHRARARLLYVFASTAGSAALCDAAAALLERGARDYGEAEGVGSARRDLRLFAAAGETDGDGDDGAECDAALAAARSAAVAVATRTETLTAELVGTMTRCCTAEAVVEFASLMSFAEMWRRMDLLFSLGAFALH